MDGLHSIIIELQILLLCVQLTCLSSQRAYVKFHLKNYYDHSFREHNSLGSPKGTLCLNPMKYHGVSIENTYCYWLPSIVTQSIIYNQLTISPIGQNHY